MKRLQLFSLLLFCSGFLYSNVVETGMKELSFLDRYCMKVFFDQAIKYDQATHVIYFNNKAVCLTGPFLSKQDKTFKDIISLRGWRAFKKNEHLFPHPNFIFADNLFVSSDDFKVLQIYIINKEALRICLTKNMALFQKTLGSEFSSEQFISQLEEGRSLPSLLNEEQILIGILLGYGEESAQAFNEIYRNCTDTYAPHPTGTYCRIDIKKPANCKLNPVVFMGNPNSPEVKKLVNTYELELEEAWSIHKQYKNSLKLALKGLCDCKE